MNAWTETSLCLSWLSNHSLSPAYFCSFSLLAFMNASLPDSYGIVTSATTVLPVDGLCRSMSGRKLSGDIACSTNTSSQSLGMASTNLSRLCCACLSSVQHWVCRHSEHVLEILAVFYTCCRWCRQICQPSVPLSSLGGGSA